MADESQTNTSTDQLDFLEALSRDCPPGLHFLVSLKTGKHFASWAWDNRPLPPGSWYFYTGASDHKHLRRAENTRAVRAIVIDDVGTKVKAADIKAEPTWVLETSPGNYQWGYLLREWTTDIGAADALMAGIVAAGLQDKAVSTSCRLFRVPGSINDKEEYPEPFEAVLTSIDVDIVYTLKSLATALKVKPGKVKKPRQRPDRPPAAGEPDPVFDWLQAGGHVLERKNAAGWWLIQCPWSEDHNADRDDGTKYMCRGDSDTGVGQVWCHHTHGQDRGVFSKRFFDWVMTNGGPPNRPHVIGISDEATHILAAIEGTARIVQGARDFKEDMPPMPREDEYTFGSLRQALGLLDIGRLPYLETTTGGKFKVIQPTTYENVEAGLAMLGVQPRLNLMTADVSFILPERIDMARFGVKTDYEIADMVDGALSDIFVRAGMKDSKKLKDIIARIANSRFWHPMQDWILSKPWDGQDRLELLCQSVPTPTPGLFRTYLRRWLLQTVAASCGWAEQRKAQKGLVLVLVGAQRIGKTRWFSALAPDFAVIGKRLDVNSRDSIHQVLQGAIVEFGELDATFAKSEISALKAFITEDTDQYRLPFAAVWLRRPRCASFCGSVNDPKFLADPTGNGRFLPIKVEGKLDVAHGVDMQQLWAQVHSWWKAGEQHWLTDAEEAQRDEHLSDFEAVNPVFEQIEESLDRRKDTDKHPVKVIVGAMHMLMLIGADHAHPKLLGHAGLAMTRLLGEARNLIRRGSPTKKGRWIINATSKEMDTYQLCVARPEVA